MSRRSAVVFLALAVAVPASAADLYVAPDGDDQAPGTKARPLRSLEAARDAARKFVGREAVTVWLRGGAHRREGTFALTAEDSGTAEFPVVYRAVEGEKPVLEAGRVVRVEEARKPEEVARKRLPEAARDHVLEVDGKALGLTHLGPWPDLVRDNGGIVELFFDGRRLPLARWPNDEPTTMQEVLDPGEDRPPDRRGGSFVYRDARHTAWPVDAGVWLTGYWRVPWQMETVRVKAIDAAKKSVTLAQPVAGGIGSKFARPKGSGKEPYWVVNLLEELDAAGEWCLDFATGKIYVWPPADLKSGGLVVADLSAPVIACRDASWVTFRGLTLAHGLGDAVAVAGGRDVRVAGCTIHGFGQSGVVVKGGEHHEVVGCDLFHLGDTGIVLEGGDRAKLLPAKHAAVNNHIHHYGEVKRVYSAGVNVGFPPATAVGMHVAHNRVHDAPHAGILYGGNDNVLELNDIHHVCLTSDDMGGLYTWHDWTSRGNLVRHNFVHDSPKAHGVYCDDGDSGDTVVGNVFFGVDAGVFLGGGHDNVATGNLAVDCKVGVHIDARGVSRGYNLQNKAMVERVRSVKPDQPPWKDRFPTLADLLDNHPELPTGVVVEDNVFVRCKTGVDRRAKAEELRFVRFGKNLDLTDDPGFLAPEKRDFRIKEGAAVYADLPGFRPIPLDKVGLVRDEYRPNGRGKD